MIEDTELTTLDDLAGLGSVGIIEVRRNRALTDFSALRKMSAASLEIAENSSASRISLGPITTTAVIVGGNGATSVDLELRGNSLVRITVLEAALESLRLQGGVTADLTLGASPMEVDSMEVDIESVELRRVSLLGLSWMRDAAALQAFNVPQEFLGVYGSALDLESSAVDEHFDWLMERGFSGTFEVCSNVCDGYTEDVARWAEDCPSQWRDECVVLAAPGISDGPEP